MPLTLTKTPAPAPGAQLIASIIPLLVGFGLGWWLSPATDCRADVAEVRTQTQNAYVQGVCAWEGHQQNLAPGCYQCQMRWNGTAPQSVTLTPQAKPECEGRSL